MKTEFETATTDLARRVPPHSAEAERAVLAGLILVFLRAYHQNIKEFKYI